MDGPPPRPPRKPKPRKPPRPKLHCAVEGCERPHDCHGWCKFHGWRVKRYGDPYGEWTPKPKRPKYGPTKKRGRKPIPIEQHKAPYVTAHHRVRIARGKASEHSCVRCGKPAKDWAYTHDATDERVDAIGRRYSLDVTCYIALCRGCHTKHDRWWSRKRAGLLPSPPGPEAFTGAMAIYRDDVTA